MGKQKNLEEYLLEINKSEDILIKDIFTLSENIPLSFSNAISSLPIDNIINDINDISLRDSVIANPLFEIVEYTKDTRSLLSDIVKMLGQQTKDIFFKEQQREQDVKIQIDRNELIEQQTDLLKNLEGKDEKSSGLSSILSGGLAGVIPGLAGLKGLKMPGLGALKGGAKILGKLAAPIAIITGVIDFIQGFSNAKEITGRDGFIAKIQGGISSIVSGFSFGLISPKAISEGIDVVFERIVSFFTAPFTFIKNLFNGKGFIDSLGNYAEDLSFGLWNFDKIKEMFNNVKDRIKEFFTSPIEFIKGLFKKEEAINNNVLDQKNYKKGKVVKSLSKEGIIDKNIIGKSKINNWKKIETLPVNEINEIIAYDDWDRKTIDKLTTIRDKKKQQKELQPNTLVDKSSLIKKQEDGSVPNYIELVPNYKGPIPNYSDNVIREENFNITPKKEQNKLLNETKTEYIKNNTKYKTKEKKAQTTNNVVNNNVNNTYQNNTDLSVDTDDYIYKKLAFSF